MSRAMSRSTTGEEFSVDNVTILCRRPLCLDLNQSSIYSSVLGFDGLVDPGILRSYGGKL